MLTFTQEILYTLKRVADETEARSMSKNVKEQFEFLGVKVITRRELTYPIFEKHIPKNSDDLIRRVEELWGLPYRELQYVACDYLFRHRELLMGNHLGFLKKLIKTRAWRDTVDVIATSILGDLAWRLPAVRSKIAVWIRDPNIWIRRSALIFQLQYREKTDWSLLRECCVTCADDEDFYIRNGIGRALCEYARINPSEVKRFVLSNVLSMQIVQEVLKHV
ncbi:MAG: DNA alkylation repair protein [Fibrobacter sp.]|nr:DNA alkylation repair protein [Fibrobacter sp.]